LWWADRDVAIPQNTEIEARGHRIPAEYGSFHLPVPDLPDAPPRCDPPAARQTIGASRMPVLRIASEKERSRAERLAGG
jgi:hypothetical protein